MMKGRDNEEVILLRYFFQQALLLGYHRKEKLGYNVCAAIFLLDLEVTSKSIINNLLFIFGDQIIGKVCVDSWNHLKQESVDGKNQEFSYWDWNHVRDQIIFRVYDWLIGDWE